MRVAEPAGQTSWPNQTMQWTCVAGPLGGGSVGVGMMSDADSTSGASSANIGTSEWVGLLMGTR